MKLPGYAPGGVQSLTTLSPEQAAGPDAAVARVASQFGEMGDKLFNELQDRRDTIEIQQSNAIMSDADAEVSRLKGMDYIPVRELAAKGIDVSQYQAKEQNFDGGATEPAVENFKIFPELQAKIRKEAAEKAAKGITYEPLKREFQAKADEANNTQMGAALVTARDKAEEMQQQVTSQNIIKLIEQAKFEDAQNLVNDLSPTTRDLAVFEINKANVSHVINKAFEKDISDELRLEYQANALAVLELKGKDVLGGKYDSTREALLQEKVSLEQWMYAQSEYKKTGYSTKARLLEDARHLKNDQESQALTAAAHRLPSPPKVPKASSKTPKWMMNFNPQIADLIKRSYDPRMSFDKQYADELERDQNALYSTIMEFILTPGNAERYNIALDPATQTMLRETVMFAATSGVPKITTQVVSDRWVDAGDMQDAEWVKFYDENRGDLKAMTPDDAAKFQAKFVEIRSAMDDGRPTLSTEFKSSVPAILDKWNKDSKLNLAANKDTESGEYANRKIYAARIEDTFRAYAIRNTTPRASAEHRAFTASQFTVAITQKKYRIPGAAAGTNDVYFSQLLNKFENDPERMDRFFMGLNRNIYASMPFSKAVSEAYLDAQDDVDLPVTNVIGGADQPFQ